MSEKQTEAQRLADELDDGRCSLATVMKPAAAELRRLDAENEKLREKNGVLQYALTAYKDMELHLHAEQDRAENLEAQLEAVEKQRNQMQQAGQQALNALQVLCDEYGRQMTAMNHKTPRRAKWTAALSAISALSQALEAEQQTPDLLLIAIQNLNSNPYSLTKSECIDLLKELRETHNEATAQQQAEPVFQMQRADGSWVDQDKQAFAYNASHGWPTRILYTRPQPAQWVGLTDDDIDPDHPFIDSIRAIEAKLRDKNACLQPAQQHQVDHKQKTSKIKDLRVELQGSVTSSAPAAAAQQSGGIPSVRRLVPVEPTPEMLDAAAIACDDRMYPADMYHGPRAEIADRYIAMLAAAPEAPERQPLMDEKIAYAKRYAWLRSRDVDAISSGGVFAGMTPENVVLNGEDLDAAIDAAIERAHGIK